MLYLYPFPQCLTLGNSAKSLFWSCKASASRDVGRQGERLGFVSLLQKTQETLKDISV